MTISNANKNFIDSLIDYYISEIEAYRVMTEKFVPEIESVSDTTFGIVVGCVYSGFLQIYQSQQLQPALDDINEFHHILKVRSPIIKKAIIDSMRKEKH